MAMLEPERYFAAAFDTLAREGASGLRIGRLCRTLAVTSGSFYHHFGSWAGFVEALLAYWETEQTARLVDIAGATSDPVERVDVLKRLATDLPHATEAAIRAWAAIDATVGRAQRRVDDRRRDALRDVLSGVIDDPRLADRMAVMGMSILVGFQLTVIPPDVALLRELFDDYQGLVLGSGPRERGRAPR
jgi:AcrR family transcriptional regulator